MGALKSSRDEVRQSKLFRFSVSIWTIMTHFSQRSWSFFLRSARTFMTRTPQVPMRGEKTGRRCRQEVNGRAVGLNRELKIKQVDGEIAWELIGGEILIARIESSGSSRNICSK